MASGESAWLQCWARAPLAPSGSWPSILRSASSHRTSLGATDAYLATADGVEETIREATGGGVHHAIELAGSVAALELGYKIVRRGGTLITAGLPPRQPSSPSSR